MNPERRSDERERALLRYDLERHFGEPKRTFLLIEPAQFSLTDVLRWYAEPELLAEWLAVEAADVQPPSEPGGRVRIPVANSDLTIEGETLAITRREVALGWIEENVVLELKAFMMGPNPVVSVRGTTWQPDAERFAAIERAMEAALKRLAGRLGTHGQQVGVVGT